MQTETKCKMKQLPIEIINYILCYLTDDIVYLQYEITDNKYKETYKINMHSNSLWNIQSIMIMKRLYPLPNITSGFPFKFKELYENGKKHYKNVLRDKSLQKFFII